MRKMKQWLALLLIAMLIFPAQGLSALGGEPYVPGIEDEPARAINELSGERPDLDGRGGCVEPGEGSLILDSEPVSVPAPEEPAAQNEPLGAPEVSPVQDPVAPPMREPEGGDEGIGSESVLGEILPVAPVAAGGPVALEGQVVAFTLEGAGDGAGVTATAKANNLTVNAVIDKNTAAPDTIVIGMDFLFDGTNWTCQAEGATVGACTPTTVTLTATSDKGIQYTIVVTPQTKAYELTATGTDTYEVGTASFTGTLSASAVLDVPVRELIDYTVTVNWNDNNKVDRPQIALTLAPAVEGKTPESKTISYNNIEYTYKGLFKCDENGKAFVYTVTQEPLTGYLAPESDTVEGKPVIRNTLAYVLSYTKEWRDAKNEYGTRPAMDDWKPTLAVWKDGSTPAEATGNYTLSVVQEQLPAQNRWTVAITGLPAFDAAGLPLSYYVVEQQAVSTQKAVGEYVLSYRNSDVHANITDKAYNGCQSISLLSANTKFEFTKVWVDGDTLPENRPHVTFYLYRYAKDGSHNESTASPVKGMDNMKLESEAQKVSPQTFTYTVTGNTILPKFDNEGYEYVYFLTEKIPSAGDYVSVFTDASGTPKDYLYNRGTATNKLSAQIAVPATKTWNAKAIQGMDASVTLQLQSSADGKSWTNVEGKTMTLTGFTAERMTLTDAFEAMPKYDDRGYLIQYRVAETSATVNQNDGTGSFGDGDEFTADGYKFKVSRAGNNTIINTLIGTTKFRVKKNWQPDISSSATIQVRLLQNGSNYSMTDGTVTAEAGSTGHTINADGTVSLTGTGDFSFLFENLPRYDATGAEYAYTVEETTKKITVGEDEYNYDSTAYSNEDGVKTATITNIHGEGETLRFELDKVWLDESDTLHRLPVTVGIYYTGGGVSALGEPVHTQVLNEVDQWHATVTYTPSKNRTEDGEQWKYANYTVREIMVGDHLVTNSAPRDVTATGSVETNEHLYTVSYAQTNNHFTVKNLRVGTLKVDLTKTWKSGQLNGLEAQFTLYRKSPEVTEPQVVSTKILAMTGGTTVNGVLTNSITFENLDKYDAQGRLYNYTVQETGLRVGSEGDFQPYADGVTHINTSRIVASYTPGTYVVGPQHTNDVMKGAFTNQRTDSGQLYVNKVWRDGDGQGLRPDIVLKVYRSIDERNVIKQRGVAGSEPIKADRLWDTKKNDWLWECDFGTLPMYDANGFLYNYFVVEDLVHPDEYSATYYNGTVQPVGTAVSSEATFSLDGDANGLAFAEFHVGGPTPGVADTIINTRAATRAFDVRKIWLNLPSWFQMKQLPPVTMLLYRSKDETDATKRNYSDDMRVMDGATQVGHELENGSTAYTFANQSKYDKYGWPYYYYIKEDFGKDTNYVVDGHLKGYDPPIVSGGNVTNTYNTETPNVKITVNKTWDWSAYQNGALGTMYPDVTFKLHQVLGDHNEVVATKTVDGNSFTGTTKTESFVFEQDDNQKNLLYFAPDGTAFTYYVTEDAVTGYTTTRDEDTDSIVLAEPVEGTSTYTGDVAFTNIYVPGETSEIVATKKWEDQGNKFNTRPTNAVDQISFTLWRKTKTLNAVDITEKVNATWSNTNTDTWTVTFAPKDAQSMNLEQYATTGEKYTYYVVEKLEDPYYTHYDQGGSGLNLTNSLRTTNVNVMKQWADANGERLSVEQVEQLKSVGEMPGSLTFGVERSTDNTIWEAVKEGGNALPREIAWKDLLQSFKDQQPLRVATGLPEYKPNDTVQYKYRVREIVDGIAVDDNGTAGSFTVSYEGNNTVTNKLAVKKLSLEKVWADANNQDGIRPASIVFVIHYKHATNGDEQTQDVTLKPTASGDNNRWTAEFTLPNGYVVVSVTEKSAYGASIDGYTSAPIVYTDQPLSYGYTNTHIPKTISIEAIKKWVGDGSWKDITRPASIDLTLQHKKDGNWENVPGMSNVTQKLTPSDESKDAATWSPVVTWTDLPAYWPKTSPDQTTAQIEYRVVESGAPAYNLTVAPETLKGDINTNGALSQTLTNTLKTVNLTVQKAWNDSINLYNTRPQSDIVVVLQRRVGDSGAFSDVNIGNSLLTGTLKYTEATKSWSNVMFMDLPTHNASGVAIQYTVREEPVITGYAPSVTRSGNTITVTNALTDLTSLEVTKTWDDADNKFAARPTSVTFKLQQRLADEGEGQPGEWTDITNVTQTIFDTSAATQGVTFAGLPKRNGAGKAFEYQAVEVGASKSYEATGDAPRSGPFTQVVTNRLKTMSLTVSKTWSDGENMYFTRPDAGITVKLRRKTGENAFAPVKDKSGSDVNGTLAYDEASKTWSPHAFTGLPVCDATGAAYVYDVVEATCKGYTSSYAPLSVSGVEGAMTAIAITNTLSDLIQIDVTKAWSLDTDWESDVRPDSVVVRLQQKLGDDWVDVLTGGELVTRALSLSTLWQASFEDLPRLDSAGNVRSYRVVEDAPNGYENTSEGDAQTVTTVAGTNVYAVTVTNAMRTASVSATKVWDDDDNLFGARDNRDIAVELLRRVDEEEYAPVSLNESTLTKTITYDADTKTWSTVEFAGLPTHDKAGKPYDYDVQEVTVPAGYVANVETKDGVLVITNAPDPAAQTTLTITKAWADENPLLSTRPANVVFQLQQRLESLNDPADWHNIAGETQTLSTAATPQTVTFSGLPKANTDGLAFEYRAVEVNPAPNYDHTEIEKPTKGEGGAFTGTVTNTLKTVSLSVKKVWVDDSNRYSHRPQTISLALLRAEDGSTDYQPVTTKSGTPYVVTLDVTAQDEMQTTIENLPATDATGQVSYSYKVEEAPVEGYVATTEVANDGAITITNTLTVITLSGEKKWVGDREAKRPAAVTLTVKADGKLMMPQPTPEWSGWNYTFKHLPRYVAGTTTPVKYTVEEAPLPAYVCAMGEQTVDGSGNIKQDITNNARRMLLIDNVTVNPARSGATDAGGFVGLGDAAESRDKEDYKENATRCSWRPELNWRFDGGIRVKYREDDAESTAPVELNATATDLSKLKTRFPGARTATGADGKLTLILADDAADMPYQTDVYVFFVPTLATENTTQSYQGGQVRVSGGTWSERSDGVTNGRYEQLKAEGKAETGWRVSVDKLVIGRPGTVTAGGGSAGATPIKPDSGGAFTALVPVTVAGSNVTLTVKGRVNVTARDASKNPTTVEVVLGELPVPLDIGIPFEKVSKTTDDTGGNGGGGSAGGDAGTGDVPRTGDDFPLAQLALLAAALLAVAAGAWIWLRRSGKKGGRG